MNKTDQIKEFKKLSTISDKLNFWEKNLKMNYIHFLENFNDLEEFHSFTIIDPSIDKDRQQWGELNKWILENFEVLSLRNRKSPIYLNLGELKLDLENRLKKTVDKISIQRSELKIIDESFIKFTHSYKKGILSSNVSMNIKFNASIESYSDYLNYKILPDYTNTPPGLYVLSIANGKTLAEYRLYIQSLLQKQPTLKESTDSSLTLEQIALLLHFCSLLNMNIDTTEKTRIFAPILGLSYKNLYDAIRDVHTPKIKSLKNLNAVLQYMKQNKLNSFTDRVSQEIDEFKKSN